MEGKNVAYLVLAGVAAYAGYKLLVKPVPVNPGEVQKVQVLYTTANSDLVISGFPIYADVTWKNIGASAIAPTFRLDIKDSSSILWKWTIPTPQEGVPVTSPKIEPGKSITVRVPSINIPLDWTAGTPVTARVILIGYEGVWDEQEFSIAETTGVTNFDTTLPVGTTIAPGGSVSIPLRFTYSGIKTTLTLKYALGAETWFPTHHFNVDSTTPEMTFSLPIAAGQGLLIETQVTVSIPTGAQQKTYDSYARLLYGQTEVASDIDAGILTVSIGGIPPPPSSPKVTRVQVSSPLRASALAGGTFNLQFAFDYTGPSTTLKWTYDLGATGIWPWPAFTPEPGLHWEGTAWIAATNITARYTTGSMPKLIPAGVPLKTYGARIRIFDANNNELKADTDADALTISSASTTRYKVGDRLQIGTANIYLITDIVTIDGILWYVFDNSFRVEVSLVDSSSLWHIA